MFNGEAEYDSIRAVKQKVSIPVIANGDITDPLKARAVLDYTGGGCPDDRPRSSGKTPGSFGKSSIIWTLGSCCPPLPLAEVKRLLCAHVRELHDFYGPAKGYRIARKHVSSVSPRNTLQMTSFGAHSTPLRMPANSWRRWRHTSKILRKQK
ncbi:tRNA-dihydrouridine synthase [Escherichia coli]|nr:tRNA-dihydrouridine synthase [Escherichia coli]